MAARPTELERPTDPDCDRSARMCVGAGDEGVVEPEDIHLREGVGNASASVEAVVPQETIVLKETFLGVNLAREIKGGRRWRSETQSAVGPLPRREAPRRELSLQQQIGAFYAGIAAIIWDADHTFDEGVGIVALHGEVPENPIQTLPRVNRDPHFLEMPAQHALAPEFVAVAGQPHR